MKEWVSKNKKDVAAFASVAILVVFSMARDYHLGVLVGLLVSFVFFSYERIKGIIIELNIKRIFGVEFGELERGALKESIKDSLSAKGAELADEELEAITDNVFNRLGNQAHKGYYYEHMVKHALDEIGASYTHELSGVVGGDSFQIDFVVDTPDGGVVGIEAVYTEMGSISKELILRLAHSASALSRGDKLVGFVVVTNSTLSAAAQAALKEVPVPIDVVEGVVSPGAILSKLGAYLQKYSS